MGNSKKTSSVLKQVLAVLAAVLKAKTLALKTKTSAVKTRLAIFGLLHSKWTPGAAVAHKIQAFVGTHHHHHHSDKPHQLPLVGYDHAGSADGYQQEEEEEEDGYPDMRHWLFDEEEEEAPELRLEDEVDRAADVFIRRFHREMRLQKQESLERYRDMLQRSL